MYSVENALLLNQSLNVVASEISASVVVPAFAMNVPAPLSVLECMERVMFFILFIMWCFFGCIFRYCFRCELWWYVLRREFRRDLWR